MTVENTEQLAATIADAVLAHPSVIRLDGGRFDIVATHLPGRRVVGVRVTTSTEPVEISVVLTLGQRLPDTVEEIRKTVREIAGPVPVHVTVTDVIDPTTEPVDQKPVDQGETVGT